MTYEEYAKLFAQLSDVLFEEMWEEAHPEE